MNSPGTWAAAAAATGFATFAADTGIRSLLDPGHEVEHWTEYDRTRPRPLRSRLP